VREGVAHLAREGIVGELQRAERVCEGLGGGCSQKKPLLLRR